MGTQCELNVNRMFAQLALNVHLNVHWMCTECELKLNWKCTKCAQKVISLLFTLSLSRRRRCNQDALSCNMYRHMIVASGSSN